MGMTVRLRRRAACLAGVALGAFAAAASAAAPAASPDVRAERLLQAMTRKEKLSLVHGLFGASLPTAPPPFNAPKPEGAIGSAGYAPGVPRLGVPALQESDASLGVANGGDMRPGDQATALPSTLSAAASFDPALARRAGAMIGAEAHAKGFNVLLAGGANLARDPRNGRNFEYAGEDPLLTGRIVGAAIAGVQSQHVISTAKHFALNDQETGRGVVSEAIDERAARESDLLAFQIALEIGRPGAVMTGYNRVNGVYASESPWLLGQVLKLDWGFRGWVMSDWGGVHSTRAAALAGLDQESAHSFDELIALVMRGSGGKTTPQEADYFGAPLRAALDSGEVPAARLDDMVRRILRSLVAEGVIDHPAVPGGRIDRAAHAAVAQAVEEAGAVLLKNDGVLPLARTARRIAVIGGHADVGVLSGGGSSQVIPYGGAALSFASAKGAAAAFAKAVYGASSPLKALRARFPDAEIAFASGEDAGAAAALAKASDVAVVFAGRWQTEGEDAPDLTLPDRQDALIASVAEANPRTAVVLETGNPVLMPWLDQVGAVLEAWYPGQRGGAAIARLLAGDVTPSGRLPVTFPRSVAQLPRPVIDGAALPQAPLVGVTTPFTATLNEGADVGYRWYARTGAQPLFPFGYGLSYTRFAYSGLRVERGRRFTVSVVVRNTGARTGVETAQLYVTPAPGAAPRLAGWARVTLKPGARRRVVIVAEPRTFSDWTPKGWARPAAGAAFKVGADAADPGLAGRFPG